VRRPDEPSGIRFVGLLSGRTRRIGSGGSASARAAAPAPPTTTVPGFAYEARALVGVPTVCGAGAPGPLGG